jgi:hypothetical protein
MRKTAFLLIALVFGLPALVPFGTTAQGSPIFIDEFTVTKNGLPFFTDPFSDGVPPPSAPNFASGTPGTYFVDQNATLNESGGKVRLDTVGSAIVPGIGINLNFFFERALLLTNIDQSNLIAGLKNDDTFSVQGLFDLAVPTQSLEYYGIRLEDSTGPNTGNDILDLAVRRGLDGIDRVQFFRIDDVANTVTFFASVLLDPNHDQILLDLTRPSTGSDAITGSFAYVDGGVVGPFTSFGTTVDIFRGENFTRASFLLVSPAPASVPEPSTLILLGIGLAALAAPGWRRSIANIRAHRRARS